MSTVAQAQAQRAVSKACTCGRAVVPSGECAACLARRRGVLQRRAVSPGPLAGIPPVVNDVLGSPGRPLDQATRAEMEQGFGHDFSQVRLHTDAKAAESARVVNAHAYTVGHDIAFAAGNFKPWQGEGRKLLAHELAHVMQQAQPGGIATSMRAAEQDADQAASRSALGLAVEVRTGAPTGIQRQEASAGGLPGEEDPLERLRRINYYASLSAPRKPRAQPPSLSVVQPPAKPLPPDQQRAADALAGKPPPAPSGSEEQRWIDAHPKEAAELAGAPLSDVALHQAILSAIEADRRAADRGEPLAHAAKWRPPITTPGPQEVRKASRPTATDYLRIDYEGHTYMVSPENAEWAEGMRAAARARGIWFGIGGSLMAAGAAAAANQAAGGPVVLYAGPTQSGARVKNTQQTARSAAPAERAVGFANAPVFIRGQATRLLDPQNPADAAKLVRFGTTVRTGKELGFTTRPGKPPQLTLGSEDSVTLPGGLDISRSEHTHPPGSPAIFSGGDVIAKFAKPYSASAEHSVVGYKWPSTNVVLLKEGLPVEPGVVETVATHEQFTRPGAVYEIEYVPPF